MANLQAKLGRYLRGLGHGLRHFRPQYAYKLFSGDNHAIRRTLHGFRIIVDLSDPVIGRSILLSGTYEKNVTDALLRLLRPDTHFLDIGANIGWFSLLVAAHAPQGKVFSFEPDPRVFEMLSANIALNGYGGIIQAYHNAASDHAGEIIVTDLGNASNYGARFTGYDAAALAALHHGPNPKSSRVQAVAIDELLPDTRIDLVKADIEGFEPYAFRGIARLLERDRPRIVTEFAPSNLEKLGGTTGEAYLEFFTQRGYRLNVIDGAGNLVDCGQDAARVMDYYHAHGGHHLDLCLLG